MDLPEAVSHNTHPFGNGHQDEDPIVYSESMPHSVSELASLPQENYAQPISSVLGLGPAKGEWHVDDENKSKKWPRCNMLVLVLYIIIAVLLVTTIGLAVGTGVGFSNAKTSQEEADRLRTSPPTVTYSTIDRNCTDDAENVTGTKYDTFSMIGSSTFTIQCNKDTTGDPLLSLFTSDFDGCMDACAAWSRYTPTSFGSNATNATCGAVSFVPLWTNKTAALNGTAPGNCYLKPIQTKSLKVPNIGSEVHAGVLDHN